MAAAAYSLFHYILEAETESDTEMMHGKTSSKLELKFFAKLNRNEDLVLGKLSQPQIVAIASKYGIVVAVPFS